MKNGLGKLASRTADQLAAIVRNRLKRIQYWPRPHSLVRTRRPRREAPKLA